jgi:SNO glutamine amidotransferase family
MIAVLLLLLQALVGGLDVEICRNYFGAQISSFEQPIDTTALDETLESETSVAGSSSASTPYPAIFIRAPAILSVCTLIGFQQYFARCVLVIELLSCWAHGAQCRHLFKSSTDACLYAAVAYCVVCTTCCVALLNACQDCTATTLL